MPTNNELEVFRYHLQPGFMFVSRDPALVTTVVGSCVAVCLYDRRLKSGGINHYFFPKAGRGVRKTPQFGDVAVSALIRLMISQGSRVEDMEAQIFGGGWRSLKDTGSIGVKNVKIARKMLKKKGIKVVSEDTGGIKGRRVVFHTRTNEVIIMKTHKVRRGDWHPYQNRLAS